MKCRLAILALLTTVVWPMNAGDDRKCNASARECEVQIRQMLRGRRYLGLQVVDLRPGWIVVKSVNPDGPAFNRFREGDRIMAVNGRTLKNMKEFKQILYEAKDPGTLWIVIQRRNALQRIWVRLEPYSQEQIGKIIAQHMARHTVDVGAQR